MTTATPVIRVNSATGSDTAASGAGPTTAITGSAGVSAGTTVTLDGSPNLSGLLGDGSEVIYFADATAGNRNFSQITAFDNALKTVTVAVAFTAGTKAWAIGGTRLSAFLNTSLRLTNNNSSTADWGAGWVIEMASGHSESGVAGPVTIRSGGDITSGPCIIRGAAGASTYPLVTFNNNGNGFAFGASVTYFAFQGFQVQNSNATKSASIAVNLGNGNNGITIRNVKVIGSASGTQFWKAFKTAAIGIIIEDCEVANCANFGMDITNTGCLIQNCWIHDNGSHGISVSAAIVGITNVCFCIIAANTGDGINIAPTGTNITSSSYLILNNTIDSNTSDGLEFASTSTQFGGLSSIRVESNIISNNGTSGTAYGVNFSGSSVTDILLYAANSRFRGNSYYNNRTANCNLTLTLSEDESTTGTNPTFTNGNSSSSDYSIGTNLKAKGYPLAGTLKVGTSSNTTSYIDPGAAQRQEPSGSAGPTFGLAGNGPSFKGTGE